MLSLIRTLVSFTKTKQSLHHFTPLLFSSSLSSHSPITSLLLANKPLHASNFLHRSTSHHPPTLYNSTLAALSAHGHTNPARNLFDTMRHRKVPFNDLGFGCFVKRVACKHDGLEKILSLVEEVEAMGCGINGSVAAVLIVDGLCRAGKIDDAWAALEELRVIGWKPDFIAYRIVAEEFKLASRVEEAGRILKQKRKFGVAPRSGDYREFIVWLISERRLLEAKELGEAIVYGDFPIDDNVLDSLIGSVSDIDPGSAVSLFKHVMKKDWLPGIGLLQHLCMNLCKIGNGDVMWELFRNLLDKGYFSGVDQYNLIVSLLCAAGKLREAYDVLKEMKKNGFAPDISSYNCLMEACCREDLLRPAKKLWDEMFANGCSANLKTYNILIKKLLEEGEVMEAQQLFHHMVGKGISPDDVTYKMLVRVLCREKNVDGAVEIFYRSVEQDVNLATSILSTLILNLCREGNYFAASSTMRGLPPNVDDSASQVILLKSLTDAGEIEMALKSIEWIKMNSPVKLHVVLTELIASFSTAPNLEPVLHLLRAMHAQGLVSTDDQWMKMLEGDLLATDLCA